MKGRLNDVEAVDSRDNLRIEDAGGDYIRVVPIDETKRFRRADWTEKQKSDCFLNTGTRMDDLRAQLEAYDFRSVHPNVHFGTASDRYTGWIGQIYPEDVYAQKVSSRKRKLGGKAYEERTVPVRSVRDYF